MEISPLEFVKLSQSRPVLDVRSPGEFDHGHFPGAVSFPLFDNTERAEIGTLYKQVGRQPAFERGLEVVGPKIKGMVVQAQEAAVDGKLLVHCWRGGMRSQSVAQLLSMSGLEVKVLRGGYKAFRNWVLEKMAQPFSLRTLGGMTGSGKTKVLQALAARNVPVIDLEALADHMGSAFGHLPSQQTVTQQQFENELALELHARPGQTIWVEDESPRIGPVVIPNVFHAQLLAAPLYMLEVDRALRIQFLTREYGQFDRVAARESILRIKKQLGGLRLRQALEHFDADRIPELVDLLLDYYDKFYRHSVADRPVAASLPVHSLDFDAVAEKLIDLTSE